MGDKASNTFRTLEASEAGFIESVPQEAEKSVTVNR